ncbi:MAG TPA: alpha/beta hydrolase [Terriglobales bacterium]|jgi:pimeloyl-ACP methyl ester carboxylesterase
MAGVRNVVLVHGAWADGSCWSKIIPILKANGLHAVAPQNPLSTVADDVASTNRLINAQEGPVLLVGHSYGGVVITEAGNNPKVAGLVYVAAFAPDEGESLGSLAAGYPTAPVLGDLQPLDGGYVVISEKGIRENFAQDLAPEEQDLILAVQGATSTAVLGTPVGKPAWRSKPTWFVVAEHDRAISPEQEAATAKRMGAKTLTLSSSHLAMLSQPEKVAQFIVEAARSVEVGAAAA